MLVAVGQVRIADALNIRRMSLPGTGLSRCRRRRLVKPSHTTVRSSLACCRKRSDYRKTGVPLRTARTEVASEECIGGWHPGWNSSMQLSPGAKRTDIKLTTLWASRCPSSRIRRCRVAANLRKSTPALTLKISVRIYLSKKAVAEVNYQSW